MAVLTSTHNLCFGQKYEKNSEHLSENFQFLVVKFSIYLNRRVIVMHGTFACRYFVSKVSIRGLTGYIILQGTRSCHNLFSHPSEKWSTLKGEYYLLPFLSIIFLAWCLRQQNSKSQLSHL